MSNQGGWPVTQPAPEAQPSQTSQGGWTVPGAANLPTEIVERLKAANFPLNRDGVLMLWERSKTTLTSAKDDEMMLRKLNVSLFVEKPREGMNNVDLGNGFTLKAGVKFNYKLDNSNTKIEAALDKIAAISNEGTFIAERLVSWTPNFQLTEYRELQAKDATPMQKQIKAIIDSVLVIDNGSPTLEIKAPKKVA